MSTADSGNGKSGLDLIERLHAKVRPTVALIKASLRPLPTQTGDGTYIAKNPADSGDLLAGLKADISHDKEAFRKRLLEATQKLGLPDTISIKDLINNVALHKPIDDRTYFMEKLITFAADQPLDSKIGVDVTNAFLRQLWNDLQHPPLSYLDNQFKYRQADGRYNNIRYPELGAANTPYARTVQPKTALPFARPDPGLLFDCLMARPDDKFTPHPNRISSTLFYLATIIIHDIFYTSHVNRDISLTSSYLDLAPLYGNNQAEQDAVRTGQDGKLKPDVFSEKRILGQPPGVGLLLIMFNRFHNDVATKLAFINEGGRFTKPTNGDAKALAKHDNDLFQTARLVTSGLYINIILKDYVRTILKLNQTDSLWDLDPRTEMGKTIFGTDAAEGVGNQVSAEFNLVYRWHSTISKRDAIWTEAAFKKIIGQDANSMTTQEVVMKLIAWEKTIPSAPEQRDYFGLKRNPDGTLPDDELVEILASGIEDVAGAFGANKVPKVLKTIEVMGIVQSRAWNLATLNEFRAFFNLSQYTSFEQINPDPVVADQLKHLYDTPDQVEIYPGLVIEAAKEPHAASGLCPPYTTSRAILSDAVALVRGDRFYTIDYTPRSLTNWGHSEVNYDVRIDEGHVFYKLILRAFPHHFKGNSIYAHYPLVVPEKNKEIFDRLGKTEKYDWSKPSFTAPPVFLTSYQAATKILDDKTGYHVTWGQSIGVLINHDGKDYAKTFMLAGDGPANERSRQAMSSVIYKGDWARQTKAFFENVTLKLLHRKSYKLAGTSTVDIVRDIGNIAQAHFAANMFCIPLKTPERPRGVFTELELYEIMAYAFACIFYDVDPVKSLPLREVARAGALQVGKIMQEIVTPLDHTVGDVIARIEEQFRGKSPLPVFGIQMFRTLLDKGYSVPDAVWSNLLPTCAGMVANQAQVFAQVLYFYLSHKDQSHWKEISRLAKLDTPEADDKILHYFMEGMRLAASTGLFREAQKDDVVQDGSRTVSVKKGQRVVVDLTTASLDPTTYPDPEKVDPSRPLDKYITFGWGPHSCLGLELSQLSQTTLLKTVARLDNLRLVAGPQGRLPILPQPGHLDLYLTEDGSQIWPFPASLKVHWDGQVPTPTKLAKEYEHQDWGS